MALAATRQVRRESLIGRYHALFFRGARMADKMAEITGVAGGILRP